MGRFFLPRQWRLPTLVWFLMIFEFPFTVANLALFGIASPNLYRTILWREGGRLGFNSDPSTIIYAYANYRPVSVPVVWSAFNTQYHLVIGVVCMFFLLVKATLWLLKVFFPILSVLLHIALLCLWAYGIHVQTAPDTIDPQRPNPGAPWYITRSCGIVEDPTIRGYCMQAKSSFAVSIIMLTIYTVFLLLSLYSILRPTAAQRSAHAEKLAEKEKWAAVTSPPSPSSSTYYHQHEMSPEQQWQHMWELQQLPRTPGGPRSPMTPRTTAFSQLEGGRDRGNGNGNGKGKGRGNWIAKANENASQGWYKGGYGQAGAVGGGGAAGDGVGSVTVRDVGERDVDVDVEHAGAGYAYGPVYDGYEEGGAAAAAAAKGKGAAY